MSNFKTNAMRILDTNKIPYTVHTYQSDGDFDGCHVAQKLGCNEAQVFKTLITQAASKNYYVFVIPVMCELDLKAAAREVGEKSVEMIAVRDINRVSGYIRGGCSPIGMKKQYVTVLDESALMHDTIIFSAGKIGYQVELSLEELKKVIRINEADIIC